MATTGRLRVEAFLSTFVSVQPHETSALLHSASCFFFILSAYFVVLPLRDEGAISLGLSNLPGLFVGSLLLTLIAAPLSTLIFSFPSFSKTKALFLIHRFFSLSLVLFFVLWHTSSAGYSPAKLKAADVTIQAELKEDLKVNVNQTNPTYPRSLVNYGWFYVVVRIGFFLWVALLNLITISSTWARIIDVMDTESGSRLFGFIGAGATLGQLCGSLFATGMAWLGSFLLLFAALLMELAAQSSKGIDKDVSHRPEELSPIRDQWTPFLILLIVITASLQLQKVAVIAMTVTSSVGRRRMFAEINSFIAIFILAGQLTLTGRILTIAGITIAICSAPVIAFLNLVAISVWPTWVAVAACETMRKVVTYVVTRPGRELLFTVVSQEEKYKAKVCIDVIVQRLGDATAAGMYKLLFGTLRGSTSTASLYALPVCVLWIATAFHLGQRQAQLAKLQTIQTN